MITLFSYTLVDSWLFLFFLIYEESKNDGMDSAII